LIAVNRPAAAGAQHVFFRPVSPPAAATRASGVCCALIVGRSSADSRASATMPMAQRTPLIDAAGIDAAIARVLQAESKAREDVQRCALEAEATVEGAQQRARQIARRAAHRSVRVQRWYAEMLQRQLETIAAQQGVVARAPDATDAARRDAIETLAAQLTGPA
jgi:vacuolar-type H+-ATPase subunit H